MQLKKYISVKGKEYNEDILDFTNSFAYVLDGATGLGENIVNGYESDAYWFVNRFKEYSQITPFNKTCGDFIEYINTFIETIRRDYADITDIDKTDKFSRPSAGAAFVVKNKGYLEFYNIGDCQTIVELNNNELRHYADIRLARLDNRTINKMVEYSKKWSKSVAESREYVTDMLRKHRALMNTKGGYSALSFDELNINDFIFHKDKITDIKNICLYSDGAAEYYEHLGLANDYKEFYKIVKDNELSEVVNTLRAVQEKDKNCNNFPRLKKQDDVSILLISAN